MKKMIIFFVVGVLLIGVIVISIMLRETEILPENCDAEIIFDNYIVHGDFITFNCRVFLENHSSEDKLYKIIGDFKTEYNAKMIYERTLMCHDRETGYEVFFVPAQSECVFNVSFFSTGDGSVKKPDRLPPVLAVEEVSNNISTGDGSLCSQEKDS